jgi:hypothetical protein
MASSAAGLVGLSPPYTMVIMLKWAGGTGNQWVWTAGTTPNGAIIINYPTANAVGYMCNQWVQAFAIDSVKAHYTAINFTGGGGGYQIDGTYTSFGGPGPGGLATAAPFTFGNNSAGNGPGMQLCEVIFYHSGLSSAQFTTLQNYLVAKWAPTSASGTATLPLGPLTLTSSGTATTPTITGTATLNLGPLAVTATSKVTGTATATLNLGPLTVTTLATWTSLTPIPLGPLTLTSTSAQFVVPTITLGPLTLSATSLSGGGGSLARLIDPP